MMLSTQSSGVAYSELSTGGLYQSGPFVALWEFIVLTLAVSQGPHQGLAPA